MDSFSFDRLGYRLRLGVVIPSTNTSVQPEYDNMRPPGVTNHIGRIMLAEQPQSDDRTQLEVIESIQPDLLPAIDRVVTCDPHAVIMGMSLPTFWGGLKASHVLKEKLENRAGRPVYVGSHACLEAIRCYGKIRRLAILSPYQPVGNAEVERFFRDAGFEVLEIRSFLAPSPRSIARVAEQEMIGVVKELAKLKPDLILQAGTNLAMADLADEAERWLDMPVIAINAATYWQALRGNGIKDQQAEYGRLLREF